MRAGSIHCSARQHRALLAPLDAEVGLRRSTKRDVQLGGWVSGHLSGLPGRIVKGLRVRACASSRTLHVNVPDFERHHRIAAPLVNDATIELSGTARQVRGGKDCHLQTRSETSRSPELLAAVQAGRRRRAARGRRSSAARSARRRFSRTAPVAHGRAGLRDGSLRMANLPERSPDRHDLEFAAIRCGCANFRRFWLRAGPH